MANPLVQNQWWLDNPPTSNQSSGNDSTPPAEPTPQPAQKTSTTSASKVNDSFINPQAYTNAISQVQAKLEKNSKLVQAKKAIFKHMYDQPLTPEEQNALTPSLKIGMMRGDRNMIDMSIQAINDQIKGFDASIDNNLANYVAAANSLMGMRASISSQVASMIQNNVDPSSIAGLIQGATGGMISPSEYGFSASAPAINAVDGSDGGECGHFVNQYLGNNVFGDTIQQKESMINSFTPTPGAVAIIPTTGATAGEGHVAIVESVNPDGTLNVVESNWNLDGKVDHRTISPKDVAGYYVDPTKQKWTYAGGQNTNSTVEGWVDDIKNGRATMSNVPNNLKTAVSNALAKQDYVTPAQKSKIMSTVKGYPKLIKGGGGGGIFGIGKSDAWEYIDPATGQVSSASSYEEAANQQNILTSKALGISENSDNSNQSVVNDGSQDYNLQPDGTYLGDDGKSYQMNDDETLTLIQ